MLGTLTVAATVCAGGYYAVSSSWNAGKRADAPLTSQIRRATLRIIVTEHGNLESCVTVDGICEVNANQVKIISLVPEGTKVKKGDIVCKFDSSDIDKNISQQDVKAKQAFGKIETSAQELEIQRNKGESDIIAARVELTLAELDLEKYQKGDYPAETTKQKGDIGLKKKDFEEAKNKLDQFQTLMKKGFKTPEQVRIQEADVARMKLQYESAELELKVKQTYEYKRKTTEFSAKSEQARKKVEQAQATLKAQVSKARSEYEAAKATFDIEQQQLKEYLKQKDKTIIRAGQDGIVAYANQAWYDSSRQIREGATVYSLQKVFSLPDMTRMQVKVNIHESLIKKIKPGQTAEIRIESFPSIVFRGTVKTVSQLADSTRPWLTGGVKQYPTVVELDTLEGQDLKPGMTAETRIIVGVLNDVLVAPITAIAEHKGAYFAFVVKPDRIERRPVKIGENNESHVQILEGLAVGEVVALDARTRAGVEFKLDDEKESAGTEPKTSASNGAAAPAPQ